MKTIKKIFIAIAMCLIGVVVTGCFNETVQSLTIEKMPNTTFEVGTEQIENLMTIVINDDAQYRLTLGWSVEKGLEIQNAKFEGKIELNDFDLTKEGNYTASVKYNSSVSYFDYQVVRNTSLFAGGNGSANNPYQITNVAQFMNINVIEKTKGTEGVYFKLMNDIDMADAEIIVLDYWYDTNTIIESFKGVLEGNNKKLYNLTDELVSDKDSKEYFIFGELSGAVIKNLDVHVNGTAIGLSCCGNSLNNRTLRFTNVNMYGTSKAPGRNFAEYTIYSTHLVGEGNKHQFVYSNIVFEDCDSYVTIIGQDQYVAVFTGYVSGVVEFNDCWNHGYVEAPNSVGVFFCNPTFGKVEYTITNSGNKGTLVAAETMPNGIYAVNHPSNWKEVNVDNVDKGTLKQVSKFEFASFAKLDTENKLTFEGISDSEIAYLVVDIYVPYVNYTVADGTGTTGAHLRSRYDVVNGSVSKTNVHLESLVNGVASIKLMNGEGTNANEWLEYRDGSYVYDGTKIMKDGVCSYSTKMKISVFAYDKDDNVVSAYVAELTIK